MSAEHIHAHTHHHHARSQRFSLLRASAVTRLALAAGGAAVLWLSAGWALGWFA